MMEHETLETALAAVVTLERQSSDPEHKARLARAAAGLAQERYGEAWSLVMGDLRVPTVVTSGGDRVAGGRPPSL